MFILHSIWQAKNAGLFGAKGIILYSDPADWTVEGEEVYPDGLHLPGTGTQRGSTMFTFGDPLTPGYPAVGKSLDDKGYSPGLRIANL